MKDYTQLDYISKANMSIVDDLLNRMPDWEEFILPRRQKFIKSYLENGRDLRKTAEEFDFSIQDMLSIFWRIQKELQAEHKKRLSSGEVNKKIVIVKAEKAGKSLS